MRSDERIDRFWLPKLFGTHVQKQHFRFYFRSEFVFAGSLGERQALVFAFCFRENLIFGVPAPIILISWDVTMVRCQEIKLTYDE